MYQMYTFILKGFQHIFMLYHHVACCIFVGNVNKWTKKVLESCVSRKVWTPRGCWQAPNHSLFSLQSISSPVWAKVRGELGQKGNKGSSSDALTMRSRELASSPQRPGGQPRHADPWLSQGAWWSAYRFFGEVQGRVERKWREERKAQWMASLRGPGWARSGRCHSLF